jgi:poly-gamma-glutamate synthesis protein (capsule biosynthesis protein)
MSFPRHPTPTARGAVRFRPHEELLYRRFVARVHRSGARHHPMPTSGDIPEMTLRDAYYWVYKAEHPVERAERGSGLEEYFAEQGARRCELPPGFEVAQELTLSAVGDLMNHEYLARSSASLYRDVGPLIFGADVAMANLECVLTSEVDEFVLTTRSGPRLSMDQDAFDAVKGTRERHYDLMATACNHSLDFGADGVTSTIAALRASGIAWSGVNEREEDAKRATILERRGIRLGVLSFTFGLNGRRPPRERPRIVNTARLNDRLEDADFSLVEEQLRHCRAAGVDFTIAQLHWGLEHELYPRPAQLEAAHDLAELGIDAIFGHHPHVPQPTELYRTRRDPARIVPIYYSLSNLTSPFSAPLLCRGRIARVTIAKGRSEAGEERSYVRDACASDVLQVADEASRTIALVPDLLPAASRNGEGVILPATTKECPDAYSSSRPD